MRFTWGREGINGDRFEVFDHLQGSVSRGSGTRPIATVYDADLAENIVELLNAAEDHSIKHDGKRLKQYTRKK